MLQIRQQIGKGHSLRESGKEGLFPVPGTQSNFKRINDNKSRYLRIFGNGNEKQTAFPDYFLSCNNVNSYPDNTGIPLNRALIRRFHLQILNESVNHSIKIISKATLGVCSPLRFLSATLLQYKH